jgi:hypothetical protein
MGSFRAAVCSLTLLFVLPHVAGQPTHRTPRISMSIGSVTIWLGMPKAEALLAFESAGLTTAGDAGGLYAVVGSGATGSAFFTNGKLTYADREWLSKDHNDVDAILGAFEALSSHSAASCKIQHTPMSEPDQKANRIFVDCGERGILIMSGSYQGTSVRSVTERIGHFTPSAGY